jgi:hypothetical protein
MVELVKQVLAFIEINLVGMGGSRTRRDCHCTVLGIKLEISPTRVMQHPIPIPNSPPKQAPNHSYPKA